MKLIIIIALNDWCTAQQVPTVCVQYVLHVCCTSQQVIAVNNTFLVTSSDGITAE